MLRAVRCRAALIETAGQPSDLLRQYGTSGMACSSVFWAGTSSEMQARPDIRLDIIGSSVGQVFDLVTIDKQPKVPT